MQEVDHQVVFRMQYPSASSAVAGSKRSSDSSAVAGTGVAPDPNYMGIPADLLTEFQRNTMLRIRDEFMSFTASKCKLWRKRDGTLLIVGHKAKPAPLRTKPRRETLASLGAGRP